MTLSPNEILTILYNNFDPDQRADSTFYVDCTDVRGGDKFASKLCSDLSRTDGYIHTLFTGHIGCGKSSELQHLAETMGEPCPPEGRKRFLPVFIDTSTYLDRSDVDTADILLAIIGEMAAVLRDQVKIAFRTSLLDRMLSIIRNISPAVEAKAISGQIGAVKGPSVEAKATFQRLQQDPTVREKVRKELSKSTLTLLDEINLAFTEARIKLKKHEVATGEEPYHDFVIILDNLEKVDRFENNAEGDASHRALFIQKASQLKALSAHIVYTVPLSLLRSDGGELSQLYSGDPFVLPAIKTEQRGSHAIYVHGQERLKEILAKRIPPGVELTDVFTPDALDFIVGNSGGHVRNLLRFARESVSYGDNQLPISIRAAYRSIGKQVSLFTMIMRPDDWNRVAELEASTQQTWDSQDAAKARLLEQLAVLEYVNGGNEDPFNETAPWYAVNPIVRQMNPFKDALQTLKNRGDIPAEA